MEASMDYAANLALFLLDKTGSIWGKWEGRLTAAEQRALLGRFLGKGWLRVDGGAERVTHTIKVAYGMDWDTNADLTWADLDRLPTQARYSL
jgi:hypothetical protein